MIFRTKGGLFRAIIDVLYEKSYKIPFFGYHGFVFIRNFVQRVSISVDFLEYLGGKSYKYDVDINNLTKN